MNNTSLGNARWEEPQEIADKYPYRAGTFWLGRAENNDALGYRDDRHVCLVSGNRGGKGTSVIVNNLCLWPGSAVVVDPKGENATVTAARRGRGSEYCDGMGQAVHVLDPFKSADVDPSLRSRFNPLDALDPNSDETIDESSRLANALVVVKEDGDRDPYWDEAARAMVRGLILHVLTCPAFAGERNLLTVRALLTRGDWQLAEQVRERGGDEDPDPPHRLLWRAMELNPAFNGVIAGLGTRFGGSMDRAAKTYESVLQVAVSNTEFLDSPGMRDILQSSDFQLSELKTRLEGMTLYLSLPQRFMSTHYRWLRMMISLTTTEMEIVRGQPRSGHPVLMVLDEFAGLKRMDVIEKAVAQIAGYGVKLFFVLQSLEQLKATYKDNWETFLSNAGLKVFFSIEDHFTREYVSKLIGEAEIMREVRTAGESVSQSESVAHGTSESWGQSQSQGSGTSSSRGQSTSDGTSVSNGINQSTSQSKSGGTNETFGSSSGGSNSVSYRKRRTLFGFGAEKVIKGSESYSEGNNWSNSHSTGTQEGWSNSSSAGTSQSQSQSQNRSQSFTEGLNRSQTSGTSQTSSNSHTTTHGSSRSANTGRNETLHHRALISPDDVGRFFARIDHRNDPTYPGLALLLITGGFPAVARRVNYYEDVQFIRCFDPHPDHVFRALSREVISASSLQPYLKFLSHWNSDPDLIWLPSHDQQAVSAGQIIGKLLVNSMSASIISPVEGIVTKSSPSAQEDENELFTVTSFGTETGERFDAFADIGQLCMKLMNGVRSVTKKRIRNNSIGIACAVIFLLGLIGRLIDEGPAKFQSLGGVGVILAILFRCWKNISAAKKEGVAIAKDFPPSLAMKS